MALELTPMQVPLPCLHPSRLLNLEFPDFGEVILMPIHSGRCSYSNISDSAAGNGMKLHTD